MSAATAPEAWPARTRSARSARTRRNRACTNSRVSGCCSACSASVVSVAYSSTRPGIDALRSALRSIIATADTSSGADGSWAVASRTVASCARYTSTSSSSRCAK